MDARQIRNKSMRTAQELGYSINTGLPLIDPDSPLRTRENVIERLLTLHALAAVAYGFDRQLAHTWLRAEGLVDELEAGERAFLLETTGQPGIYKVQVEGMWALAWTLHMIPHLDFAEPCDDRFVLMLPNLKEIESGQKVRRRASLRSKDEILAQADLAYCLHWSINDAQLRSREIPGDVAPFLIIERRRALDWCLSKDAWESVLLDT